MARKRNDQLTEEEKKIISERVKKLFEELKDKNPKLTQKEISKNIGVSEATITRIFNYDGIENFITLKNLMRISEYFKVNIDYLVGYSKSKTLNTNNKAIADKLKLSDEAIELICSLDDKQIETLNYLLESNKINELLKETYDYLFTDYSEGFTFIFGGKDTTRNIKEWNQKEVEIINLERIKETLKEVKNSGKK